MDSLESIGRWLVVLGVMVAVVGGLVWIFGRLSGAGQFPGTLRFNIPGGTCVIPILGSILLSIILTVVLNIVARLMNR